MNSIKALFGILVVVAGFYLAVKLIPPYFNNYQFEDEVQNSALMNSYSTKSIEEIQIALAKKAREYDIPLKPDQIHVERNGNELSIWTEYTIRVDLPGFPVSLKFHPATKNKRI
jgi:YbbR domain-containing protein